MGGRQFKSLGQHANHFLGHVFVAKAYVGKVQTEANDQWVVVGHGRAGQGVLQQHNGLCPFTV